MANNVGYATLQVIPSMRNLGKHLRKEATPELSAAGTEGGREFGEKFTTASTREVKKSNFGGRILSNVGGSLTKGLGTVFRSAFTALPVTAIAAVAAPIAAALSAAVVAGATSGIMLVLGGGVLAAGIALAAKNGKVQSAWAKFGATAKKALSAFSAPFVAPLVRAAATLGRVMRDLTPSFREAGRVLAPVIDTLAPALGLFARIAMPGLLDALKASVPVLTAFAEGLPNLGAGVADFFSILAQAGPDVTRLVRGFMDALANGLPVIAGYLVDVTRRFVTILDTGKKIATIVAPAVTVVRDAISQLLDRLSQSGSVSGLRSFFDSIREPLAALGQTFSNIGRRIGEIWKTQLQPFFADLAKRLGPLFQEFGETIRSVLTDLNPIISQIWKAFDFLWTKLGLGTAVLTVIRSIFDGVVSVISGALQIIRGVVKLFAGILTGDWSRMWEGIKQIGSGIWKLIVGLFKASIIGQLVSLAKSLIGSVGGSFTSMMSRAASAVSGGIGRVIGFFSDLVVRAVKTLGSLPGKFISIAGDVIGGFARGIRDGAGRIVEAIKAAITDKLPSYVKKALGIASPSRVFMSFGEHVSAGMAIGITKGARKVTKALDAITTVPDAAVFAGAAGVAGGAPSVRVYIGDRELTDLVRVEMSEHNRGLRRRAHSGVR